MASRSVCSPPTATTTPGASRFGATPAGGEAPLWAGFAICQPAPSPTADGTLLGFEVAQPKAPEAGLRRTLADWLSAAAGEEVPLLFVHGFNFTFAEALVRAADGGPPGSKGRRRPANPPARCSAGRATALGTAEALSPRPPARRRGGTFARPASARHRRRARPQAAARPVLLAHSMGVYALRCGLQALAPPGPSGCSATPS